MRRLKETRLTGCGFLRPYQDYNGKNVLSTGPLNLPCEELAMSVAVS